MPENTTSTVSDSIENVVEEEYMKSYRKYATDFIDSNIKEEPILSEKSMRYTAYPVQYPTIWRNYKIQHKAHWVVEEIDLSKDCNDWDNVLTEEERYFLSHVLAFFAASDGLVNSNLRERFIDDVKINEAQAAFGKQIDMENTHSEAYSLMLYTYIKDSKMVDHYINAIKTMPCIKKKADWCKKWIESDKTFAHRVVAFAVVEGVFFSGSFASIFWLKPKPGAILNGAVLYNKLISRDEGLHMELAFELKKLLKNVLREEVVQKIVIEALEIEKEFIIESLPCRLLGINSTLMIQYIEYVADRVLVEFGYNKLYNSENPFEFMKQIDIENKENFFEGRVSQYANSYVDNSTEFANDLDF